MTRRANARGNGLSLIGIARRAGLLRPTGASENRDRQQKPCCSHAKYIMLLLRICELRKHAAGCGHRRRKRVHPRRERVAHFILSDAPKTIRPAGSNDAMVVGVSAFQTVRYVASAAELHQLPPDRGAEVAFVGRSNAGKSSALNAICERRKLAFVSRTPGRTQMINFFALGDHESLVDLPGYGYARVPRGYPRPLGQAARFLSAGAACIGAGW
jgi:hypothetical protein